MTPICNILIPLIETTSKFKDYGFITNKYFLPIDATLKTWIETVIQSLNVPRNVCFIFSIADLELQQLLSKICITHGYNYKFSITPIANDYINNDIPLIVFNPDIILNLDFNSFIQYSSKYDKTIVTYSSPDCVTGICYYNKGSYLFENRDAHAQIYNISNIEGTLTRYEDYFNYYNCRAPIQIIKLEQLNSSSLWTQIGNKQFHFDRSTGEQLYFRNELVIVLNGPDAGYAFLSGALDIKTFPVDTYLLRHTVSSELLQRDIQINEYVRGWLIGNFEPSIMKTTEYEIGIMSHFTGEHHGFHYHQHLTEFNILLSGKILLNNIPINAGTIFIMNKNIIACSKFLEDCKILCIKVPSVPGDKTII